MKNNFFSLFFVAATGILALSTTVAGDSTMAAFEMLRASKVLETAIAQYKRFGASGVEQPMCSDVATGFYVFCITIPEDPQDLVFMVHPTIPSGTALRDIPDSVNAQNALPIIYDSVNECTAIGELILATYQWDNSAGGDGSDEVLKTSLLQEFTYNRFFRASETIACGIQVNEEDI